MSKQADERTLLGQRRKSAMSYRGMGVITINKMMIRMFPKRLHTNVECSVHVYDFTVTPSLGGLDSSALLHSSSKAVGLKPKRPRVTWRWAKSQGGQRSSRPCARAAGWKDVVAVEG